MRYFIVLLILLLASPAIATVQFFPADSPTLGANALDTILGDGSAGVYEALANGDAAVVITTGLDMCVYLLDFDIIPLLEILVVRLVDGSMGQSLR